MAFANVLILLAIGWFVLVLFNPRVHWHVQSWQYRDPEANYPSEAWFTMQRIIAVFGIVLCSAILFMV